MTAYLIANYTIVDPEKYAQYQEAVEPTVFQYDGKPLVAGADFDVMAGEPQQVVIVLEFESKDAINAWYTSEEYSKIKHLREEASADGAWSVISDKFKIPI